jgi:hypothetical protein
MQAIRQDNFYTCAQLKIVDRMVPLVDAFIFFWPFSYFL